MMSTRRTNVNITKQSHKLGSRERRSPRRTTKTPSSNELKNKYKSSPKGKRKLDFPFKREKGPLAGKLFYLDLNGYNRANQVKSTIIQLGGTIEEFFRKEVTYLVTNRGDCGKSPSSQSAPSPGTPSPIPLTRSSSIKNYAAASPMSTDSPQGMDTQQSQVPNGTMRGKSIAKRSIGFRKGTTDILSNASTWGVNILHVDQVLKWISQLMLKAQQQIGAVQQKTSPSSKRVAQTKVPKVVALQETYLKVEDLAFKYRPLIHEFKVWPEVTFDGSNVCPFDPPRRRSSENSMSKRKSGEGSMKKPIHERPKHGYCECCEVRYVDLDVHLKGKQHKEFARKDSNYISLDEAINEGPRIADLLDEIQLKKSNSSLPNTAVMGTTSLSVSCDDTEDVLYDDVFLLSTPRSSRRNKNNISNHTSPSDKNRSNEDQQKKPSTTEDDNDVKKNVSVSKPSTPKKRGEMTEHDLFVSDPKQIDNTRSGPFTRLQKASSNSSSPRESKHILSVKGLSKRVFPITANNKRESSDETVGNNEMDCRKESNSLITNGKNSSKKSPNQSGKAALTKHGTDCTKSRADCDNENIVQDFTGSNDEDITDQSNHKKVIDGKGPKTKASTKIGACDQTHTLKNSLSEDNTVMINLVENLNEKGKNNAKVGRKRKSITLVEDELEVSSGCQEQSDTNNMQKSTKNCLDEYDREDHLENSNDSPRLSISSKNAVSEQRLIAMCPGALIFEENKATVRSSRRKKSIEGICHVSPIQPCNVDGEHSVVSARSSCSENIEFLPLGLRICSSFGSSLGIVSKDLDSLVDRIEKEFYTDSEADNKNTIDQELDVLSGSSCGELLDLQASGSVVNKNVMQNKTKDRVENIELQVSLTYLDVNGLPSVRGENVCPGVNVKRKRKLNDEEEPIKARKCKRLSEQAAPESQEGCLEESFTTGDTFDSGVTAMYRSSVAERVKLNRAILESLQDCSSPGSSPQAQHSDSSPQMRPTSSRKRKIVLESSPFAEITNTCKKGRERAKSEGRIRPRDRFIARQTQNGGIRKPRSACLTPNDPFIFDDY